jgi:cysteine-rich repeat protein
MVRAHGTSRIAYLVIGAVAVAASVARADIDATGNWLVTVTDFGNLQFTEDWVQAGPVLVIDGDTGTIDPQTGVFYVAFPPNPLDPCSGGSVGGTVAPDGQTFTAAFGVCGDTPTLCCALHPGGNVFFNAIGTRIPDNCGNGVVDPGEACDDGNNNPGDGCDPLCHVETCYTCSGAPSMCTPAPAGSACDCGFPVCTNYACNGAGSCVSTGPPNCDDANPCTVDSFDQSSGCVHTPDVRSCRSAQSNGLGVLTSSMHPNRNKLGWKWTKGAATAQSDFGTPAGTTAYTLCMFAGTTNAVVGVAEIPPSAQKWAASGHGFKYKDPSGSENGITKMTLVAGAAGKAKIIVKGKGAGLPLSSPPYSPPVTIQITNSSTNACWASTFDAADVQRNAPGQFGAKSKAP